MPGEAVVLGDAFPIFQSVTWNRADPIPQYLPITVVSYEGVDSLRFEMSYVGTAVQWIGIGGHTDGAYLDPWDTSPIPLSLYALDQLPNGNYKVLSLIHISEPTRRPG